jgi:hypothetical protein
MKEIVGSKVIVYHDETKQVGGTNLKGQILLFIPANLVIKRYGTLFGYEEKSYSPLEEIYIKIMEIRRKYNVFRKFHFNEIQKSGKWTKYNQAEKELVEMGICALRSKKSSIFRDPLFCKMAVIFYSMTPLNLYGGVRKEKHLRYHETLFRMLLKRAVHALYDEDHPIEVTKIISDGISYHRKLSDERILWRLIIDDSLGKAPLREYVNIPPNCEIVHQSSKHEDFMKDSNEYVHANMLQLADMLLGATIHSCYKGLKIQTRQPRKDQYVEDKRGVISMPVKEMLDKRKRGKNLKYSSHYKSFSLFRAFVKDKAWQFEDIITKDIEILPDAKQLTLLDFAGED